MLKENIGDPHGTGFERLGPAGCTLAGMMVLMRALLGRRPRTGTTVPRGIDPRQTKGIPRGAQALSPSSWLV